MLEDTSEINTNNIPNVESEMETYDSLENLNIEKNIEPITVNEELNEYSIKDNEQEVENSSEDTAIEDEMISINSDQKDLNENNHNALDMETDDMIKNEEIKPTVRRLSLFDTLEDSEIEKKESEDSLVTKSEPVFQDENEENNQKNNSEEELLDEEFSAEESEIEEDFNQEVEEELLDIPTFLRRQAN